MPGDPTARRPTEQLHGRKSEAGRKSGVPRKSEFNSRRSEYGDIATRTKILTRTKSAAKKKVEDATSNLSLGSRSRKAKGKTGKARHLSMGDVSFKSQRSGSTVSSLGVETLRKCHYLLVKRTNGKIGMVPNTANTYDVCNCQSERLFCVLESERRGSNFGKRPSIVLLVIGSDGNEVIRMEGWGGSVTSNTRKYVVYKRDDLIGTVRKSQCCWCCGTYFLIKDELGTPILSINKAGTDQEKKCCLMHNDPDELYYDVLLPGNNTRIGEIGKVEHMLGADVVPPDLQGSYGVELNGAMSYNQKSLLLASLFLVYKLGQLQLKSPTQTQHENNGTDDKSLAGKRRKQSRFQFFVR